MIKDHLLDCAQRHTRNCGGVITPEIIVLHYTAGGSLDGAVAWFQNPASSVSAHLVIGRDGSVVQCVPFNRRAWHAGASSYRGRPGVNGFSTGIEFVNWGVLQDNDSRTCRSWGGVVISKDDCVQAAFRGSIHWWHRFTPQQITRGLEIVEQLIRAYNIHDIVGHYDVAPTRKIDPGGAFPMDLFKHLLKDVHSESIE